MNPTGPDRSTSERLRAADRRDAALTRLSRVRRWVIVGAAALTAGFAALVSALAPGRHIASAEAAVRTAAPAAANQGRSPTSALFAPATPPASSSASVAPPVVTGGS